MWTRTREKNMKTIVGIILSSIVVSFIFAIFSEFVYVTFVSVLFLIGLIMLVVSGSLVLHEQGAFRITHYSFKKVLSLLLRTFRRGEKEAQDIKVEDFLQVKRSAFLPLVITAAVILVILSIGLGYLS